MDATPLTESARERLPQAVIFDMDGVISNSEPLHERAFHAVMEELGYAGRHELRFSDYIGRSDTILWEDFVARHHPPQPIETLLAMKRHKVIELLRRNDPIFPGVRQLVRQLHSRYRLAVASGSEEAVVEAVLAWHGLRRYFEVVLSASGVKQGKPAPDIFLETARRLQVAPEVCWVIEDSKPGIVAARAAGMVVVAIPNTHPAEELQEATHVVADYEAIAQLLKAAD